MKQKNFTFNQYYANSYPENNKPSCFLTWEDKVKHDMVQKGYLVKDLKTTKTITVSCYLSKANVPLKERLKMQKVVEKPITSIKLK